MTSNVNVGDSVRTTDDYTTANGDGPYTGIVTRIDPKSAWPVKVQTESRTCHFTYDEVEVTATGGMVLTADQTRMNDPMTVRPVVNGWTVVGDGSAVTFDNEQDATDYATSLKPRVLDPDDPMTVPEFLDAVMPSLGDQP